MLCAFKLLVSIAAALSPVLAHLEIYSIPRHSFMWLDEAHKQFSLVAPQCFCSIKVLFDSNGIVLLVGSAGLSVF